MSRFLQLHLLTAYPPANLNRDDQGSPKTAKMGGYDRLRVSSQCLKRTWRTSKIFEEAIAKGVRTKMVGVDAYEKLSQFSTLSTTDRKEIAKNIAQVFGALKTNSLELETLVFISDQERANIKQVIDNFKNGLGDATEESNSLGVDLYKILSKEVITSISALIDVIKNENDEILLKKDWSKAKGFKEIIKTYKTSEDKSPYDFIPRMIEDSSSWIDDIKGEELVRQDQVELFLATDEVKLTKDVLKKLNLGALFSGAKGKEVEYGEIKHKEHIKLCKGSKEQLEQWIDEVKKSEDDDFTSDANIEKLKVAISPVAITKSAILTNENTNADIALFGRMLASTNKNNWLSACLK